MRAAIFESADKPIVIRDDVDIIEPRAGEVRVSVKYCGICHSDLSIVNGTFPNNQAIILGHEASGIVESIGPGVSKLAVGDHVVLTPAPPCGNCYFCLRQQPSLCVNANAIMTNTHPDGTTGLSIAGKPVLRGLGVAGFAELAVTGETGAVKIPKDVPLDLACVIGCAMQTGVGAVINTAQVEYGATVLVMGLGGIGMAALQGARLAGATTIIASDPVAQRREMALKFGATHVIDPTQDDVVAKCFALTEVGVDYAFETAGLAKLISDGINATRPGGTTVCVGAPPLDQDLTISPAVIFAATEKKLSGCILGSCNSLHDIPRFIHLYQNGQLDFDGMITSRLPLADINQAMQQMSDTQGIRTVIEI